MTQIYDYALGALSYFDNKINIHKKLKIFHKKYTAYGDSSCLLSLLLTTKTRTYVCTR